MGGGGGGGGHNILVNTELGTSPLFETLSYAALSGSGVDSDFLKVLDRDNDGKNPDGSLSGFHGSLSTNC